MTRRLLFRGSVCAVVAILASVPFAVYYLRDQFERRPDHGTNQNAPPSIAEGTPAQIPPGAKSFQELYADELAAGWEELHPLDVQGPYLVKAESVPFWVNPEWKTVGIVARGEDRYAWDEKIPKGHMGLPMKAETVDGRVAHGLLVRKLRPDDLNPPGSAR